MKRLLQNWELKLLSLLSAVVLWFFVVGIENTVRLFPENIEVKPVNIGKNITFAENIPQVKVYINTKGSEPKSLSSNDFEASIDLSGLTAGDHELPVKISSKNAQVTVLKSVPEKISIRLAPVAEKEVPVEMEAKGSPHTGFTVQEMKTNTSKAKVTAVQNVLDRIDYIKAVVILDGSETADINQNVTLEIPVAGLPEASVKIEPEQVVVNAVIVPSATTKTVGIVTALTGAENGEVLSKLLIVTPSAVELRGNEETLKNVTEVKTKPVKAADLLERTIPLAVSLELPDGIELADPAQKITVQIDRSENEQKAVAAPVVITRENSDFKVSKITPAEINVIVSGPSTIIKNLKSEDITVNLNLQNVENAGSLPINLTEIIVPAGVGIISFNPKEVTLETR